MIGYETRIKDPPHPHGRPWRPNARGQVVEVYRNVHKDLWSIRWSGLVVGHARALTLADCTLRVSEAGRQRVLATGRKNVHAWVVGTITDDYAAGEWRDLRYNPRLWSTFVDGIGAPVHRAALVTFGPDGRCAHTRAFLISTVDNRTGRP